MSDSAKSRDLSSLSQYHVPTPIVGDVYYIPDFISPSEEEHIKKKISESPKHNWKQLSNRRLQVWGGNLTSKNVLLTQPMPDFLVNYPNVIARLEATGAFHTSPHKSPNHIIMNEYLPGQGIMPHEDGPTYHPVVATISLGSHTVFNYYEYETDRTSNFKASDKHGRPINPIPVLSLLLEPRSVVITCSEFYTSFLHGINSECEDEIVVEKGVAFFSRTNTPVANSKMLTGEAVKHVIREGGFLPRQTRYSLTCRDVEKTTSTKQLLRR